MSKYLFFISIFCLVGACAGRVVEPFGVGDYLVEGKLAVQMEGRNQSANFRWRQQGRGFDIEMWGPLGQGRTHLRGDAKRIVVSRGEEILAAGAPAAVMQLHMGYILPVATMSMWLSGSSGDDAQAAKWDEAGRLISFKERNWQVDFANFREFLPNSGVFQPARIVVQNDVQKVTVAIRRFQQ